MSIGNKLLLGGLLVLLMIAMPLTSQLRLSEDLFAAAQGEREGLARVEKVLELIRESQTQQTRYLDAGPGGGETAHVLVEKGEEPGLIFESLLQSLSADPRVPASVADLTRESQLVWRAWEAALHDPALTAADALGQYEALQQRLQRLIDQLIDQSGLILDPQADTTYLVSAALQTLPKLVDKVDNIGMSSSRRLGPQPHTQKRLLALAASAQQALVLCNSMESLFSKAFVANPELREGLEGQVEAALALSREYLTAAERELAAPQGGESPSSELSERYKRSSEALFYVGSQARHQLEHHLSERAQKLRNSQRLQFLSLALLLSTLAYLALLIARDYKQAHFEQQRRAKLLEMAEELARTGSAETDLMSDEVTWSPGLYRLLAEDVSADKIDGDWLFSRVPAGERELVKTISQGVTAESPCEFQHRIVRADGSVRTVLHRGMVELDPQGWPLRAVTILQDITEQREAEQRINLLANSCEITGLPNRNALLDQLDERVRQARREERNVALLALQIDQLGIVTDSMGHEGGDRLLVAVAARLAAALEGRGYLAHLGSGEYAMLLGGDWKDPDVSDADAMELAQSLCAALATPVVLGDSMVHVSCGVGFTLCSGGTEEPQKLLHQAQAALSRAHEMGDNQVCQFSPEVHARAASRLTLEAALRRALERDEFSLRYQPQLELSTGRVCGAEVLLRWHEPSLGAVSPVEFIPLAEETGLIVEIGDWVLRTACQQYMAWQEAGMRPLRMAVNLSVRQLQQPDIAWRIQTILIETGFDPKNLGLEITESILVNESPHVVRVLGSLRSMGVEISLDDFGTGYSNLSYLRRLPIDMIKVDRSIVHDIAAGSHDVSMTRAVINMAHELQLKVLAEGVETEGQLALLMTNRCDQMQGFFFSQGLPAPDFEALIKEGRGLPEHLFKRERERTLLLVDDEENILAALKRLLRRDGYKIVTATSGAQGLQRLAEQPVDVILSDQRMPGMTGVEFLRRAKELCPETVRMVLSGFTELQSITDAVNEGAIYKFLTKPWDDERLRGHIAEAFRSKEMSDENARLAEKVSEANQELATVNERLQGLLVSQRDKINREELSLQTVREMLESIPAAVIGIDLEGMVAYVNAEAERLPGQAQLLGCEAQAVLPPDLLQVWQAGDGQQHRVDLGGASYHASCRPLLGEQGAGGRGKLLVLTPAVSLVESE